MAHYFVSKKAGMDGFHEVQTEDCPKAAGTESTIKLGEHPECLSALRSAKRLYIRSECGNNWWQDC
jgi:hypothetical protein